MKLKFSLKFITSCQWGEVVVRHTVAVSDDFHAISRACIGLTNAGKARMSRMFPNEKERSNAYYVPENGKWGSALDPKFQVIDGFWRYYIEPVVEYEAHELLDLREYAMKAAVLEGQGWALVRDFEAQLKRGETSTEAEKQPEQVNPGFTSLGAALRAEMEKRAA